MNSTLQHLMHEATRLTRAGRLLDATAALRRALGRDGPPAARHEPARPTFDGDGFEIDSRRPSYGHAEPTPTDAFSSACGTHAGLTRAYKLYVPAGHAGKAMPLVVMLHGCTQDADDFAAGTRMNERAREQGFAVLYPVQSQGANPQRCWNWFKHNHQRRGSGEPALIAGTTRDVIKQLGIDERRVYIAGLSAGGAMAAIVAAAYPDLFAAVGVHSGLPGGAANDLASALALMKTGAARPGLPAQPVPTIVFHGDQDTIVHPRNGEQLIAAALGGGGVSSSSGTAGASGARARVEQGAAPQGRHYTRSTHLDETGDVQAEHWLVHGAGHAWSGGRAACSYTDALGPDATLEMLRFFVEHPRG